MDTLDKIKRKVTRDPLTGCWIWTGALKNARPNLYVSNGRQFSLPARPWMRDGKSFNHPIRILKRPPKGVKLIRTCDRIMENESVPLQDQRWGSPLCCNPDHWTYNNEVLEDAEDLDPDLELARTYYSEGAYSLDDIRDRWGDEIADQLKAEEF